MRRREKIVLERGMKNPLGYVEERIARASPDLVAKALHDGACALAFQPIVLASDTEKTAYFEGLIRIFDEENRVIPARDFIHQVENSEVGRLIDLRALGKAIVTLRRVPGLHLAINTSARSIGYAPWTDKLQGAIRKDPDLAGRLTIEITETSVMQLPEIASRFINDMKPKGLRFSLDDFGAGLTSFRILRDIPFESLKIDGCFCLGISQSTQNQPVVLGMIAMARHLGMNIIAENVEHKADMQWLQAAGVNAMQGYLFGMPRLNMKWAKD